MAYTVISDFKYGLDRRRPQSSGVPGTLWVAKNCVVTRGGDIERVKDFVKVFDLPAGKTTGFFSVKGQRYVFGHEATPAGMPAGVIYQRLQAPSGAALTRVLDAKGFDGKVYAIAQFADGNIYHYYNGSRVTAWDNLAKDAFTYESVAEHLAVMMDADNAVRVEASGNVIQITAVEPGVDFTISTSTANGATPSSPTATVKTVQANVVEVPEVRAEGTVEITGGSASPGVNRVTSVKVNGVEILAQPVDWVQSNAATANALAVAINNNAHIHGYRADASGAEVTITAPVGAGATVNGYVVAVTTAGDVTATTSNLSGGVTYVAPRAKVVTVTISASDLANSFDASWTITLNGVDYKTTGMASATGRVAFVHKSRVYSVAGSLLRFCKINTPTDWTDSNTSSGAGYINIANEVDGAATLFGMAAYGEYVAVFAREAIVIYRLMADAENTELIQVLENTGTFAPRSLVSYGANDVYYLDETGIRSLRSRDVTDSAFTSDVGSAIDPFMQEIFAEVGDNGRSRACAAIEAVDGRYMLAIGKYIVILSYFPSSKIVAWSYVDFGQEISDMVRVKRRVEVRSGDSIYAYGGVSGTSYPDEEHFLPVIETPFISAKDPASQKSLLGFDMASKGVWKVEILIDPDDHTKIVNAGHLYDTTYQRLSLGLVGHTSHFAIRFVGQSGGFASLSSTAVHHDTTESR